MTEREYRELKIRIYDKDLSEKLEAYCKNNNYNSLNECLQSIIVTFISGADTPHEIVETKGGKLITFFGKANCRRCNRQLKTGDRVYWIVYKLKDGREDVVFLCYDCYNEVSDSTIANLIKKREKLKLEVKVLKQEHEKYLASLQQLEQIQSVLDLYLKFRNYTDFTHYKQIQSSDELKKLYSELLIKIEDLARELDETIKINKIIWSKLKKLLFSERAKREHETARTETKTQIP